MITMNYETFLAIYRSKKMCSVSNAEEVVSELLEKIERSSGRNSSNVSDYYLKLIEVAVIITDQATFCDGNEHEFHNLAVTYAKAGFKKMACEIINRGLQRSPSSVDLLADFLQYGTDCDEDGKCKEYYNRLIAIERETWTWRGFDFSIDYLLDLVTKSNHSKEELNIIENSANKLAEEFKKYYPNDEQAYIAQASIYQRFNRVANQEKMEIIELKKGIDSIRKAPKCALRLADAYFEEGNYAKALDYIKRCTVDSPNPQQVVSYGYPYLLWALCNISQLFRETQDIDDYEGYKEEINKIYLLCDIAKSGNDMSEMLLTNIEVMCKILEKRTGIKNTYTTNRQRSYFDD